MSHLPLRVAIVDDEPLARKRIARLLGEDPAIDIVAQCENVDALVRTLRLHRLDAVFLDIEMPGSNGLSAAEALRTLQTPTPGVVFVTAYSQHAVRAFDVEAIDYVVKPVSEERLAQAVERVRRACARLREDNAPASALAGAYPQRMALPVARGTRLVEVDTIDRVLAQANYLEIHAEGRCYVLRRPLTWMEQRLDPARFLRVHRSHIVRIAAIDRIEPLPSGRYRLKLRNGDVLPSGRSHRERLREVLGLGLGEPAE